MNIYAVAVEDRAAHRWRYIVVAASAAEAERIAVESRGNHTGLTLRAGRLGEYEPSQTGDAIASLWWPILAIDDSQKIHPIRWLEDGDRLYWAIAHARGHDGGSTTKDERDARAIIEQLRRQQQAER